VWSEGQDVTVSMGISQHNQQHALGGETVSTMGMTYSEFDLFRTDDGRQLHCYHYVGCPRNLRRNTTTQDYPPVEHEKDCHGHRGCAAVALSKCREFSD
jgi:hypothetical protein